MTTTDIARDKKFRLPVLGAGSDLVKLEPLALPSEPFAPRDVPPIQLAELGLEARTELRTSSYTIYVDLPGNVDEMLLVHGYTGAYDLVSKRVATYLRSLESRHAPKPLYGDWTPEPKIEGEIIKPSDPTIEILQKRGYLIPLTPEEEESLFVKVASRHHLTDIHRTPGYILMPTYQCNLRCPYCFQDHMRTNPGFAHLLRVIDRPMADRILRGMDHIDAAHGITDDNRERSITFFGGEPLLAESEPIIAYLIERIRERSTVFFSAITNATELDAYKHLLGEHAISQLQVTLDGPPDEHDRRRIYPDGSGSFQRIADNITMALDLGVRVNVRMNIDRNNIGDLPQLADVFHERGWAGRDGFSPYVAPIHAGNENVDPKSTFNTWQLGRALTAMVAEHPQLSIIGLSDAMLQAQARAVFDKKGSGRPRFRTVFCGAHSIMYVIDAFADIYACWERTGEPDVRIGHIAETGDVWMNRALLERWRGRSVVSNPVCRQCRYATSCGGGCAILAEENSGDAYSNHCDGYAKRFRSSVASAYVDFIEGRGGAADLRSLCDV